MSSQHPIISYELARSHQSDVSETIERRRLVAQTGQPVTITHLIRRRLGDALVNLGEVIAARGEREATAPATALRLAR